MIPAIHTMLESIFHSTQFAILIIGGVNCGWMEDEGEFFMKSHNPSASNSRAVTYPKIEITIYIS